MTAKWQSADQRRRRRAFGVLAGLLAAGIGVGILLSSALPVASRPRFDVSQSNVQLPDPIDRLAEARAAAPYEVKLPASLPPGAALEHVEWDIDTNGVVVIDVWFSLPTGGRLHIWQTNTTSPIESIPEGQTLTIGGRPWSQVTMDWGTETLVQLSTRFEDGVTVTTDAPVSALDAQGLVQVAGSIG